MADTQKAQNISQVASLKSTAGQSGLLKTTQRGIIILHSDIVSHITENADITFDVSLNRRCVSGK